MIHWRTSLSMSCLVAVALAFGLMGTAHGQAPKAASKPGAAPAPASTPVPDTAPLDYRTLTHELSIETLRAGSHDDSGSNDYFFDVRMYALLNSSEERNKPFEERRKLTVELGTFGDTSIESLALWEPDMKLKNFKKMRIDGNGLRELAARAMTELKVQEADLAIMIEVTLFERQKKLRFFGDDTLVAKATYYPIPPTKFDTPLRTNQELVVSDDKGTHVRLAVRYPEAGAGR